MSDPDSLMCFQYVLLVLDQTDKIENYVFYIKTISSVNFKSDSWDWLQHPVVTAGNPSPMMSMQYAHAQKTNVLKQH
jgi:hypothetical protein